ncbi:MAG: hypothetical protein MUE44_20065 [Oscillatoriaceae cyanobacterium Prado104]|jgi:hypothetical protein|nr:hypothetical protein [Oscillatoriaceae cyanobacterium Prado104]
MSAIKRLSIAVGVAAALFLGTANRTQAAVVTFDDLPDLSKRRVTMSAIANGYGGFNWDNFNYISYNPQVAGSGFDKGRVSGQNLAFNRNSQPASITNTSAFNFTGAYLTAAWKNELKITVVGLLGGVEKYATTVSVGHQNPTWFNFNYTGVDRLNFSAAGGISPNFQLEYRDPDNQHFAMDNFTAESFVANAEPVPEPSTIFGSLVFVVLGMLARSKRQLWQSFHRES